ncbi:hypothetical protein [Limnoglobus roseus]|uniref:Uncharacterized protein n=1 Tax=Limnoglobus roseus TaxID=2598579 RepID=A0A5C1AM52_9BACT|nr:hypothetical protein [Limnoglobus roseus]QEL19267.1 hypothetical protein PX52LOC_06329 [Limnoglobus roseus]
MTAVNRRQRELRQRIFASLVAAQDAGASVAESRQHVAERFGVIPERVREVEVEGVEKQWPPL